MVVYPPTKKMDVAILATFLAVKYVPHTAAGEASGEGQARAPPAATILGVLGPASAAPCPNKPTLPRLSLHTRRCGCLPDGVSHYHACRAPAGSDHKCPGHWCSSPPWPPEDILREADRRREGDRQVPSAHTVLPEARPTGTHAPQLVASPHL